MMNHKALRSNLLTTKVCFLILLSLTILFSCKPDHSSEITLKLSHTHDQNHPIHQSMLYFASYVDSISKGEMKVQIYPGGQLGKERETLELLQIGTLDITKVSSALMENYIDDFKIFGFPYLFKNKEHFHRVIKSSLKDTLFSYTNKIRLVGLTFLDSGSRNIYTAKKPIEGIEDLKGLKLRVMQSSTMINMAKSLGASPTPIAMAELFTALQQGMVDGAENNLPTFYSSRHFEVCRYFHLTEHVFVPDIFVFSEYKWNLLSSKQQEYVKKSVDALSSYHERIWSKSETNALDSLKGQGIQIIFPDKAEFINTSQEFYENISNPNLLNYINLVKSLE